MDQPYQNRVYDSGLVCRNCLGVIKSEREEYITTRMVNEVSLEARPTVQGRGGPLVEESYWGRDRHRTTVGYPPEATPTDNRTVFCECGVAGAYVRAWDDADIAHDLDRYSTLVSNLAHTLGELDIQHDRERMVRRAFANFERLVSADPEAAIVPADGRVIRGVDAALADAVRYGQAAHGVREARDNDDHEHPARAD
jgi:hypothetical protein